MAQDNDAIETGTERESDIPVEADIYGYVDDGEFATVYAVQRFNDELWSVGIWHCEAGLAEKRGSQDQYASEYPTAEDVAQEMIARDPEADIQAAREYFTGEKEASGSDE